MSIFQAGHDTPSGTGLLPHPEFSDSIQGSVCRSSNRMLDATSKGSFILFAASVASFVRLMLSRRFCKVGLRIYGPPSSMSMSTQRDMKPSTDICFDHLSYGNHYKKDRQLQEILVYHILVHDLLSTMSQSTNEESQSRPMRCFQPDPPQALPSYHQ